MNTINPISMLNATNCACINDITINQFNDVAMSSIGVPSLIIQLVGVFLLFLIIGLLFVKKDRLKFIGIWIITLVLSIALTTVLIYNPTFVSLISNKLITIVK